MHDTVAAKDLLFRRLRCLANYENANKVSFDIIFITHKTKHITAVELLLNFNDLFFYVNTK